MKLPGPQFLGLAYLISELLLAATRRSRGDGAKQDRSTLRVLWIVIIASMIAGVNVAHACPSATWPQPEIFAAAGVGLFAIGIVLRWWAIVVLGRFFTVDVQIAKDHQLVETGPFRLLRHPSYTGALLAFVGFALSLRNWAALLVIVLPILAAFIHRMNVEEEALSTALGAPYLAYMRRTKRLLPGLY